MAEIYQVYNKHSGTWVKKTAGRIITSRKEKFEDIPVRGNGKPEKKTSPTAEESQSSTSQDLNNDSEPVTVEDSGQDSDSEDDSWFF